MSRAFVKEPEPSEPRCPGPRGCDGLGQSVGRETLEAHLPPEAVTQLALPAFWCPTPGCPVAYFDAWGAAIEVDVLRGGIWPKDPTAPVCACFGITAEAIETDAKAGRTDRLRDLIARSQSPEAHCSTRSPSGVCCVPEVRKLYLRTRGETQA